MIRDCMFDITPLISNTVYTAKLKGKAEGIILWP